MRRHLAFVRKHEQLDENAQSMLAGIENPHLSNELKIHLAYGLGKVHEDIGLYDQAFNYYKLANSLQRSVKSYDEGIYQRYTDNALTHYSEQTVSSLADCGYEKSAPVFVVGMPRSGTTLVEQILSSHPEVFGAGELPYIARLGDQHRDAINDALLKPDQNTARALFSAIGQQYMELVEQLSDKPVIVDKMPGNYLHVGLIKLILPNARFIHCRRSAEDTCLSIFKNYFTENGHEFKNDLVDLARTYNRYRQLMDHWHNLFPGEIYDIHYEKLIEDQAAETRKLLDHCELDWNDRVTDFHRADRTVLTASSAQVRAPIYKDSLKAWRKFESQLTPLREALIAEKEQNSPA